MRSQAQRRAVRRGTAHLDWHSAALDHGGADTFSEDEVLYLRGRDLLPLLLLRHLAGDHVSEGGEEQHPTGTCCWVLLVCVSVSCARVCVAHLLTPNRMRMVCLPGVSCVPVLCLCYVCFVVLAKG